MFSILIYWKIKRDNTEGKMKFSSAHMPGKDNCEADAESRTENDDIEWSLNSGTYDAIISIFKELTVDLFASRLNNELKKYASH